MTIENDIGLYLRARVPLLVLVTIEEQRALTVLDTVRAARDASADLVSWDIADGFRSAVGRGMPQAPTPEKALEKIGEMVKASPQKRDLYVLRDFHEFWSKSPLVRRKVRNLAHELVYTGSSLVVTTPVRDVPRELDDDAVVIDLPLPDADALRGELERMITSTGGIRCELTAHGRARLAQAALGLTSTQARRAFAKAIVRDQVLDDRDIGAVLAEKKAVIRASRALEFTAPEETPDDLGGLDALKRWLTLRERAFGEEAAKYGLPAPKGLALIGIPGTGKSLTAKMIGGMWRLPLLRLDVGAVFGSLVGESEERVRQALSLAETVAPCVLWIDELEKSFAAGGGGDSGTSQRVLGTLLTWMQEKTKPVFVVATANDVTALPPEMLRRGRFDEVFFLDLPTEAERREILHVHLRKRRRDPNRFDVAQLARLSDGCVGAELEQAVVDAMYRAFAEDRDITTSDLAEAIARLVPLSRSQRESIENLRAWLRDGRAQSASFAEAERAAEAQVRLELA
ncbi:AAA family ATPase [Streptomyces sp. NPDC013455]|uniref:AAA family ATPase n=1 Tax=Streptomyces sp. NPDC013455 TaxID=3155605 RepID=UPI0033EA3205